MLKFYAYLSAVIFLFTLGRLFWRSPAKENDWELVVAFIRLDFPPAQRDVAQKLAAGFAEILGLKIKQLKPEHTLKEIADLADERVYVGDLIKVLQLAYGVRCRPETSFRAVVEGVVEKNQPGRGSRLIPRAD